MYEYRRTIIDLMRRGLLMVALLAVSPPLPAAPTPAADFNLGWEAYEKGDYATAREVWLALAKQGHGSAQANLGFMYDYGVGVSRDAERAARWYRTAARSNNAIAQYNLALLISEGRTDALDGRTADYWLRRSAAQGFEDARRLLGQTGAVDPGHPDTPPQSGAAEDRAEATGQARAGSDRLVVDVSVGTAWPIASGYAVTNYHVVDGKRDVTLVGRDGSRITADVVAGDKTHDVAFLRVEDTWRLPPALPFARQKASLGASVFTIGFPRIDIMGMTPKLSQGIISSVNGVRDDPTSYQLSIPIQPGNSGGPLLNMQGEVVGMITSMLSSVPGRVDATPLPDISYALKVDVIERILDLIPDASSGIDELAPAASHLEDLAARIQGSVLIVMAE